MDFVIADLPPGTIVIGLRRNYQNITAQLLQVYDFPRLSGLFSSLDEGTISVLQVSLVGPVRAATSASRQKIYFS
jgi:hypothetical protein